MYLITFRSIYKFRLLVVMINNMAAHLVVEFPVSQEVTTFSGTSEEDSAYLKIFWRSIHLNPTIESRLISSDIRQRTKVSPQISHGGSAASNRSHESGPEKPKYKFRDEDPPKLTDFHRKVFVLESEDQHIKRQKQLQKREKNLNQFTKQITSRVKVQDQSGQKSVEAPKSLPVLPPISPDYNDVIIPQEETMNEATQALNDIEQFEESIQHKVSRKEPINETQIVL